MGKMEKTGVLVAIVWTICAIAANAQAPVEPVARPKAIVIGATSGIGRQTAKELAANYDVGLVGRRLELLQSLQSEIASKTYIKQIDVSVFPNCVNLLKELITEMGGLDLIVISISSFNDTNILGSLEKDMAILSVDLTGFWYMANTAIEFFQKQGSGHLVGISSVDALRGNAGCPVYSAAKAFVSRYLEGIRNKMMLMELPIYVTDILPGYVQTETFDCTKIPQAYWVATAQEAAKGIYRAIKLKKKRAYITGRWAIIGFLMHHLPDVVYNAIGGL